MTDFESYFSNIKDLPLNSHIIIMSVGNKHKKFSLLETNIDTTLPTWSKSKIEKTIHLLDEHYHSGTSGALVSDTVYDKIREYYESKYGSLNKIGAPVKSAKIRLPLHMGSMDKVKLGSSSLRSFIKKYPADKCIMDKLDGSSMLIDLRDPSNIKAYTRGNGTFGQDISSKAIYIKGLEHINTSTIGGFIRGEAIVNKTTWKKIAEKGANARNYVAGVINRKEITPDDLANIEFVAYEWIPDSSDKLSISEQLTKLQTNKYLTVRHKIYKIESEKDLPAILVDYRKTSDYEIDGIIVQENIYHPRNTSGNPKYAKAFKMNELDDSAITRVQKVEWNPSKANLLKPVVYFDKIHLTGVDIVKATGHNAKNIINMSIGKGALIKVIRSGGVIPKIIEVIEKVEPELPKVKFEWDANGTDIMLKDVSENKTIAVKKMEYFIETLGISFLKVGMLNKLYEKGCKTIYDILFLTSEVIMSYKLPGIKIKTATKIANSIQHGLNNCTIDLLAAATPYFSGIAKKKMKLLVNSLPEWLKLSKETLKVKINEIDGFSEKSSISILNGIDTFKDFYKAYQLTGFKVKEEVKEKPKTKLSDKLSGNVYIFTGFRDKELKAQIELHGGKVVDTMSKKNGVTHLIRKTEDTMNAKIKKIMDDKDNLIQIITKSDIPV